MKKLLSVFITAALLMSALLGLSVSAEGNTNTISVYSGTPDVDFWDNNIEGLMDGSITEVTIATADQLMAFAQITGGFDFAGCTIKLGADMVINSGDASTWGETAPAYAWITYFTWQTPFKGNFDGQGHVISGLYSKPFPAGTTGLFNIVGDDTSFKNVSIVNSYFESTAIEDNCAIGGLIGYIQHSATATSPKTVSIDNVHVDAILKAGTGRNVGGILGKPSATQAQYSTVNINNCSFTGSISTEGGFSGGLVGSNNNGAKLNITSCLVDAEISCGKYDDSNAYVGGILGYQNNNDITIENCAVYGSISSKKQSGTATLIGGINSSTGKNITVTINNVLLAVEPKSDLHAMLCKYWANGTINLAITSVKYDSTLLTSVSEKMFSAGGTGATGDTNFVAEGIMTLLITGEEIFTGWTAVDNDYPLPSGLTVPTIDIDAFKNVAQVIPDPDDNTNGDNTTENTDDNNNSDQGTTDSETDAPVADTTEAPAEDEGGCGSSISAVSTVALVMGVAVIALAISKKKAKN